MLNTYCSTKDKRLVKVDGRVIGWLSNGTFYKPVISSKHQLRQPPAWAIDAEAFDREVKPNAREIRITDKETSIEYQVSVENFERFKRELDRGFGRQYYLMLNHWQTRENGHRQLLLWEVKGGY